MNRTEQLPTIKFYQKLSTWWKNSLQSKKSTRSFLLRLLVASTTVLVSIATFSSYQVVRELILEKLKKNSLLEVQLGADNIDQWLASKKIEAYTTANTPTFRTMDWSIVQPFLKSKELRSPDFFFFAMINPDGSYYTTKVGKAKANLKDRKHIKRAIAGQINVSDPVISRTLDVLMVFVATPVWSDDPNIKQPIGILAGAISTNRMRQIVSSLQYGANSYAFALNSEGESIFIPQQDLNGNETKPVPNFSLSEDPKLQKIARKMLAQERGIELVEVGVSAVADMKRGALRQQSRQVYLAYLPVKEADWSLGLIIPRENIESQLKALNLMALVVLSLAMTMIIVLWKVQSFEQKQLKKTKQAAEIANQAKSQFLANMSHELRTPLNGILGYAQILNRSQSWGEKEHKGIEIIHQCGNHLLTLIDDVLDISKIEAHKLDLYPSDFHFPSFLEGVVEMICIRADRKGIEFIYQPETNLPTGIIADEKRLRQVLINLLSNAVKFTDTGKVVFQVTTFRGKSSQSRDDSHPFSTIEFKVQDTGVGIPAENIDAIFKPFEQVGEHSKRFQGTGLGLAISSQIVNLMGSQIRVESQLGVGSIFSFQAKFPLSVNWVKSASTIAGKQIIGYTGTQKTVLVIDDRWENRSVLINLLQPIGFVTTEAENGFQGLAKLLELKPDVTITDLQMPVMDGLEMLRQLRAVDNLKNLLVIVSSASVSEIDRHNSIDAGGDDFLPKPVNAQELFKMLDRHLGIEWKYAQTRNIEIMPKSSASDIVIDNPQILSPPLEELEILLALVQRGRLNQLSAKAQQIQQSNQKYISFVKPILQWTEDFEADKIEEFIQSFLEQKE